jgi:hypothetical protein
VSARNHENRDGETQPDRRTGNQGGREATGALAGTAFVLNLMNEMQGAITVLLLIMIPALVFFSFRRLKLSARIILTLVAILLIASALPGFWRDNVGADRNACMVNLINIQNAKSQWAEANHKNLTDIPTMADLVGTNKYFRNMPICPRGGKYTLGAVDQNPTCNLGESQGHKLK